MLILAHHNNNPSLAISTFLPQTCEVDIFEASQRINHHSLKTSFIKKCPNAFRENRRRQRRHHFRPLLIGFHFYEFFMPGSGGGSVAPENQSRDVPAGRTRAREMDYHIILALHEQQENRIMRFMRFPPRVRWLVGAVVLSRNVNLGWDKSRRYIW